MDFISGKARRLCRFIFDTLGVKEFKRSSVRVCFLSLGIFMSHFSRSSSETSLHICLESGVNCSVGQRGPRNASAAST